MVASAERAGVALLALTDHDSVSGLPEALEAARGRAVRLVGAVEINTSAGENVHLLGYGIRWRDAGLCGCLEEFRRRRVERVRRILEALRRLGVALEFEEMAGVSSLGRGHVADALRRKGLVASRADAFRRFLAAGRPAYVASLGPTPEEAISLIRDAGGFAVAAHPGSLPDPAVIEDWVRSGLEGLEAFYAGHGPSDTARFLDIAGCLGLVVTGGSDYHGRGSGRDEPLGVELEERFAAPLLKRLDRCS